MNVPLPFSTPTPRYILIKHNETHSFLNPIEEGDPFPTLFYVLVIISGSFFIIFFLVLILRFFYKYCQKRLSKKQAKKELVIR